MILDITLNPAPPTIHFKPILGPHIPNLFLKFTGTGTRQESFLLMIGILSFKCICFITSCISIFSK